MRSLKACWNLPALVAFAGLTAGPAVAQPMTKPQVANLIAKVENGVDEFRDYLKRRGENASAANSTAQSQAKGARRTLASRMVSNVHAENLKEILRLSPIASIPRCEEIRWPMPNSALRILTSDSRNR